MIDIPKTDFGPVKITRLISGGNPLCANSHYSGERNADMAEEYPDEGPPAMCKVIRATDKTCLAFKVLAAGRRCGTQDDVRAALRFAYENIKPKDAVVVGMFPKYEDQILLNAQYAADACAALAPGG